MQRGEVRIALKGSFTHHLISSLILTNKIVDFVCVGFRVGTDRRDALDGGQARVRGERDKQRVGER